MGDADDRSARWIFAARGGDAEAAQRLWRSFEGRLRAFIERDLGHAGRRVTSAEDVLQTVAHEVFVVWLPACPSDPSPRRLWHRALCVARNRVRDGVRKNGRLGGESAAPAGRLDPAQSAPTTGSVTRADQAGLVEALTRSLPARDAAILELTVVEGQSFEQAARELGLEADTLRKRQKRILTTLRERMERRRRV